MGTESHFIEINLIVLTWATFFLLLVILKKYAWGPILRKLQQREEEIQRSLEEADRIKEEHAKINEKYRETLMKAQNEAKMLIEQSRKAALEAAKVIEHKTKEQSQIMLQNAEREIRDQMEKAKAVLRVQAAQMSIEIAGKLLEENLDNEKNRKLVNDLIKHI